MEQCAKSKAVTLFFLLFFFLAPPVFADNGKFSVGALGGWAWSIADEAVDGFPDTDFKDSGVYGGSIMYRFHTGIAFELMAEHLELDLKENGTKFGTLKMTPVMLLLKYQGMPSTGSGFTGHADIGGGINFTDFEKGPYLKDLEQSYGVTYSIDTDDSFIFTLGAGVDYFFTKHFSLTLDGRFLLGNVDTSWEVSGPGGSANINDIDTFKASTAQALAVLRLWL
jgi:outer membrane protein W